MRRTLIILGLLAGLIAPARAAGPALAATAQVSPVLTDDSRHILLMWQPLEGFVLARAHAIYHKAGTPDAPGDYALLAVVQPTADVATLSVLLGNAAAAGFDLAQAEQAVDALLERPSASNSLAAKLSVLLTQPMEPGKAQLLRDVLPRTHPPIAMALGRAYVAQVAADSPSTFEIREHDSVTGTSGDVVASLTAGPGPVLLPAPGALTERIDASPRGHLSVLLRWCTPPALAEQSLHVSGYHLFRARRAQWIEATGNPPPLAITREELLASLGSGLLEQVNRAPIVPQESIPCLAVIPPAEDLFFHADNNDSADLQRFEEGGEPFEAGEELTYYVAALDHFRRVGNPSPGREVVVCDRMPPAPPRGLRVENRPGYDPATEQGVQDLALSWERADPAEVAHYWVYRWNSHDEALRHAAQPSISNLLARVPNTGPGARMEFVDDGTIQLPTAPPPPGLPGDAGRTFWYTVRAEDDTVCKTPEGVGNLGGPCGAAFGVLRNWDPAAPVGGRLVAPCCDVIASFSAQTVELGNRDAVPIAFAANDPRVAWAEIRDGLGGGLIARYNIEGAWPVALPPLNLSNFGMFRLEARFGTKAGHVSEWTPGTQVVGNAVVPRQAWTAVVECPNASWPCDGGFADPVDPNTGTLTGPCGELSGGPGAVEWRVYRRTDNDGRLVQIESGRFPDGAWCDTGVPAVPSRLCYFAQAFDQDGNPSALTRLGCVDMLGSEALPRPEITLAAALPPDGPPPVVLPAAIEWFCPPHGVERFEIAVRPPPPNSPSVVWMPVEGAQEAIGTEYGIHLSPRLPAGFGDGGPEFAQALSVYAGIEHRVRVRAIVTRPGENDELHVAYGPWSDEVPLSWTQDATDPGPQVPWPARPVPGIHPALEPLAEFDDAEECGRVEIGVLPRDGLVNPGTGTLGPVVQGESLAQHLSIPLPFVVYRHDVSEGRRGEMSQITPLIEGFLGNPGGTAAAPTFALTDRQILLKRRNGDLNGPFRIWLKDTQPAIRGRSYRYTVVLHRPDREIAGVRASNPVQIPE